MICYIVSVGDYDDNTVIGVALTPEKAKQIAQDFATANFSDDWSIDTEEDDPPVLTWPKWSDTPANLKDAKGHIYNIDTYASQSRSSGTHENYYVECFEVTE